MIEEALIIYWSQTGNTKKVAQAIREGLEEKGIEVELKTPSDGKEVDLFDYDLVAAGTPSYQWRPPEELENYLKEKFSQYSDEGYVKWKAPKVEGRNAIVFCTYSGPHTGKREAIPAVKYVGQFFEHLGFEVLDELYVLSEFHGSKDASTKGRMGDIRGLPDEEDLAEVKQRVQQLIKPKTG